MNRPVGDDSGNAFSIQCNAVDVRSRECRAGAHGCRCKRRRRRARIRLPVSRRVCGSNDAWCERRSEFAQNGLLDIFDLNAGSAFALDARVQFADVTFMLDDVKMSAALKTRSCVQLLPKRRPACGGCYRERPFSWIATLAANTARACP